MLTLRRCENHTMRHNLRQGLACVSEITIFESRIKKKKSSLRFEKFREVKKTDEGTLKFILQFLDTILESNQQKQKA